MSDLPSTCPDWCGGPRHCAVDYFPGSLHRRGAHFGLPLLELATQYGYELLVQVAADVDTTEHHRVSLRVVTPPEPGDDEEDRKQRLSAASWVWLEPEEAELLARKLAECAAEVRRMSADS